MQPPCIPRATYRLQLNAEFGFRNAIAILGYLRDLGISHVYASPVFASRHGSGHGYDVIDPLRIDSDLGGEDGFDAFLHALESHGLGLILDIVPNHMAASGENRWWMDVLEYGPDSTFASYFDVNWRPVSRNLENRLLLPFLARPFGEALDAGELQIRCEDGKFLLNYQEQLFPIAPRTYVEILRLAETVFRDTVDPHCHASQEWQGIVAAAESVASASGPGFQMPAERRARFEQMRERFRQLLGSSPEIAALVEKTLAAINGASGSPDTFCSLEHILSLQHYRLAFWQTTSDSINYRRFFSITDLVGVRVEDPTVFDAAHEAIIRVGSKVGVSGFRIDHIDGLRDPRGYLQRLRERICQAAPAAENPYIVVEKILERFEDLPADWSVEGTTGYDYLNYANRLLVDEKRAPAIAEIYDRWTGDHVSFDDTVYQKKKLIMRTALGVEMRSLARDLAELASSDRYARELNPADLSEALIEITACVPVYRTYVQTLEVPATDEAILSDTIAAARKRRPTLAAEVFDFLSDVLLVKNRVHVRAEQRETRLAFVGRWQQVTGSIMAKGFEDTALYVYYPLASLNEVGGDPRCTNIDPLAFHDFISRRQQKWPHSVNATTTHDTKRSEDTRARIAVLSEIPEKWESALYEWSGLNEPHKEKIEGANVPDRNEEYLLYQTLIGAWPLDGESDWDGFITRIQDYVIKATREGAVRTRWTRPNQPHEAALKHFVAAVLDRKNNAAFCESFSRFHGPVAFYGMIYGLSQSVLKVASPGVADCYQGTELWDLRLVDPDNRGLVDFATRTRLLADLRCSPEGACERHVMNLIRDWANGAVKLHLLQCAFKYRAEHAELFSDGAYIPLQIAGERERQAIAFAREYKGKIAIAVVPRCVAEGPAPFGSEAVAFWGKTVIILPPKAPCCWVNIFAGQDRPPIASAAGSIPVADIFQGFPAALLKAPNKQV